MPLVIYSLGGGHTYTPTHTYTGGMKVISRNQVYRPVAGTPGLKRKILRVTQCQLAKPVTRLTGIDIAYPRPH